ncbi:septum site-determining protein MinC [Cohnella hashimotonis]|uniref:Probable septum site-determining protein MinC n=1 Tax=Cohnella hashimotonis TaxID=2826895 RepID=A0ABT6TEW6_9BACL|nr:septum site-determining protein MinC [Cohnella hashimotonis]
MNVKSLVTIKGVKDGLVFLLDDACELEALIDELEAKLEKHEQQLAGPIVHIQIKLGARQLPEEDKERIRSIIRKQGNFVVQSIESDPLPVGPADYSSYKVETVTGMVRSGQTLEHEGHLLLLGDVNPGGAVRSTGDIYIMGALRGVAHAGCAGHAEAIIAASLMKPTQLRIADVISRPPDEWASGESWMEYAYLKDGAMQIDKMAHLHHIRNRALQAKGV